MRGDIREFAGEQDGNWLEERAGKITASEIYKLEMKGRGNRPSLTRKKYLDKILFERTTGVVEEGVYKNDAMEFGSRAEEFIRNFFSFVTGFDVLCVGLVPHMERPTLAASPDGVIIEDDAVLEIKTSEMSYFESLWLGCPVKRQHYLQMQTSMMCTQASRAHYFVMSSYCPSFIHMIVERDEETISKIEDLVSAAEKELEGNG